MTAPTPSRLEDTTALRRGVIDGSLRPGTGGEMTQRSVRRTLRLALAMAVSLFAYAVPAAAQEGVITGRVVDVTSRAPVPTAQIQFVGTTRGTVTADDGTFRIAGIRPGQYQVRVLRLGFTASGT